MTDPHPSRDITRTIIVLVLLGSLIAASFWILSPFLPSLLWATMVVVATWPAMRRVQSILWGKRCLAVAAMTLVLLLLLIVPLSLAIATIVANVDDIAEWARSFDALMLPKPPDWLTSLPVVGPQLAAAWQNSIAAGSEGLMARLAPYAGRVARWFAAQAGGAGVLLFQFLLTVAISAILFAKGETASDMVSRFARRLAGERGYLAVVIAAQAIRGVAVGVVVTALIQSFLGGLGLAIAGVPAATVLTAVMFMLCLAQLGPAPVLIPAVIWLFWTSQNLWGTVLLIWTILVGLSDNILRPALIQRGCDLPLLLIFAGVIGGLASFGIVGIFIGPAVLAVTYRLSTAWVNEGLQPQTAEIPGALQE